MKQAIDDLLTDEALERQAVVFTNYLIKQRPAADCIGLYKTIMAHRPPTMSATDRRILHFANRHPRSIGALDAYLALQNPYAELRRRIYSMLAVLEAHPRYWDSFLAAKRSPLYIVAVGFYGCRAVLRCLSGFFIVKLVGSRG